MNKYVFILVFIYINSYSQINLDSIEGSDTLYVYFEYKEYQNKVNSKEKLKLPKQTYVPSDGYYFYFSENKAAFLQFSEKPTFKENELATFEIIETKKKAFFKKNKGKIFDGNVLIKLGFEKSTNLIRHPYNRIIYLIDKKETCLGKVKLKRVNFYSSLPENNNDIVN